MRSLRPWRKRAPRTLWKLFGPPIGGRGHGAGCGRGAHCWLLLDARANCATPSGPMSNLFRACLDAPNLAISSAFCGTSQRSVRVGNDGARRARVCARSARGARPLEPLWALVWPRAPACRLALIWTNQIDQFRYARSGSLVAGAASPHWYLARAGRRARALCGGAPDSTIRERERERARVEWRPALSLSGGRQSNNDRTVQQNKTSRAKEGSSLGRESQGPPPGPERRQPGRPTTGGRGRRSDAHFCSFRVIAHNTFARGAYFEIFKLVWRVSRAPLQLAWGAFVASGRHTARYSQTDPMGSSCCCSGAPRTARVMLLGRHFCCASNY